MNTEIAISTSARTDDRTPTRQIGRCGELLVQYRLLRRGIESSQMTTDAGIDLVAYSPVRRQPVTIQVKANLRPKPGGGKGKLVLDWWLREDSPAQLVALVDLESERVWLFWHEEVAKVAQQRSSGRFHFYVYTDEAPKSKDGGLSTRVRDFDDYLIHNRMLEIFGV